MTHTLRRGLLLLVLLTLGLGTAPAEDPSAIGEAEASSPGSGPASLGVAPPPLSSLPGGANVAIIPIEGDIYDFTFDSLQRRGQRALDGGASVLVLEIDTYGGLVTSALDIAKFLKDPTQVPVPTIAWVNDKAYSAGILIAAACDEIVMSPASAAGDCAPIVYGQNLAPTERAKAYSPIATEFRNSAASHGYTYATFHAMCVLGIDLYLIENPSTGQRLVVNQADYAVMVEGDESAKDGIRVREPSGAGGGGGILSLPGSRDAGAADVVNYNLAEANQAGPDDVGNWVPVTTLPSGANAPDGRIHQGANLLFTPDATLASDIGLSKATVANDAELQRYLSAASVTRIDQTWSENFAAFLTQMWVRVLLVVLLVVGAYLELQSPGLGLPAAVALVALFGLFGAPMIIGLADVWHVLLFMLGLGLVVAEVTVTPSFGVLGIVGIIVMLASLVLSVVPTGGGVLPAPGTWDTTMAALLSSVFGLVAAGIGVGLLIRFFGNVPGLNRLILQEQPLPSGLGPDTPAPRVAGQSALGDGQIAVGQTGRVVSTLRPAGEAEFDGRVVDVVSIGPMIDAGSAVRVVEVQRFAITVEAVEPS